MANSLTSSVTIGATWDFHKTNTGLSDTVNNSSLSSKLSFSNGAGAGAAEELYSAIRTLAGGATETLDLSGALTNLVGDAAIAFTKIKAVIIELLSTTQDSTNGTAASSISVGNAASNQALLKADGGPLGAAAHTVTIPNGGWFAWGTTSAAGCTVANGAKDNLKVTNDDGAVTAAYRITLIGAKS